MHSISQEPSHGEDLKDHILTTTDGTPLPLPVHTPQLLLSSLLFACLLLLPILPCLVAGRPVPLLEEGEPDAAPQDGHDDAQRSGDGHLDVEEFGTHLEPDEGQHERHGLFGFGGGRR